MKVIDIIKKYKGDLKEKELASKLKLSPQYINDIMKGRREIGFKRAVEIGKALGGNAEMELLFELMNNKLKEAKSKYKAWIEL